ncbi:MAG: hypothetical protein KGL75_02315 [Acidobacteriota bacterium]|nr:hypothetical protein [Acidobacteriota bacterium]
MGKINWGRVILGGIVAGVVIDLVAYVVNSYVWAQQNDAMMRRLNIQLRPHAIPVFLLEGLLLGIAAVWAYSVARPRYGAGPKTAVITALGVWFIGSFLPTVDNWAIGIVHSRMACAGTLVDLVTLIVASLIGASLYKEAGGATPGVAAR